MKGPAFTFSDNTITEAKTGYVGEVRQNKAGYFVALKADYNLSDKKKTALEARMRNWYYYSIIKKQNG